MSAAPKPTMAALARQSWGDALPAWVAVLAATADDIGEPAAASEIGYSRSVVWEVIRARYSGALARVEVAVRASLMRDALRCPVLGEIGGGECHRRQNPGRRPVNSTEVRLARECPRCPNNSRGGPNAIR